MTYMAVLAVLAGILIGVVYMVSSALRMNTKGYGQGGYGTLFEGDRQALWAEKNKS